MKFFKAKIIKEGIWHYDREGLWVEASVGSEVTICYPDSTASSYFIIDYSPTQHSLYTSLYMDEDEAFIEIIEEYTNEVKEVEKIVEVPVEVKEVVSLREVLGQEIKHIEF